jgi:hypothetical protein
VAVFVALSGSTLTTKAAADVCTTKIAKATTAKICIVTITPEGGTPVSPSGGTVAVTGNTTVTATVSYTPAQVPAGETRGCGGQRKTPTGCMTFYVDGAYTLTRLYFNSSQIDGSGTKTSTYSFKWATQQYPNSTRTLTAQIQNNATAVQAAVPVQISNSSPGVLRSPISNGGKLPTFPTGPQAGGLTVAALGDGPAGSIQTDVVASMVHSWNPDMILYEGDVYQRGMKDEFLNFYQPVYGRDWNKTLPTVGNHEYKESPTAEGYFWYWNYPDGAPTQKGGGGGWYSLNAAGWHIISLNSNAPMTSSDPQGQWLAADLAADKANPPQTGKPCTLAFFHHARFSDISLRKPSTFSLWNQLAPYGADIIVNAHSHVYERWLPLTNGGAVTDQQHGITEFVVGTGGNVLAQQWQTNDSRSAFRQNTRWGALRLTLYPDHAHYEYWAAGTGSTTEEVLDSGDVACHGRAIPPATPPQITRPPIARLTAPGTLAAGSVPVKLSWAAEAGTDPIASYSMQRSCDDGSSWTSLRSSGTTTAIRATFRDVPCRFRVRATDSGGRTSDWVEGAPIVARTAQESSTAITKAGGWHAAASSAFDGGRASYSVNKGARLKYRFTGRSVAWVAALGRKRGAANVYVDGHLAGRVSLWSSRLRTRRIVWARSWAESGPHTVRIVVLGTRRHPRVDVDAFVRFS